MKSKKTLVLFLILCFLTVLIVIGSVLFSVQTIVGYCYNDSDADLTQNVVSVSSSKLKKGTNIFLVNEKEIIKEIEREIPNVKVVNIERKFPSSVYINYYRIEEYFVVEHENAYLYVSNDCKILRSTETEQSNKYIKLIVGTQPESSSPGDLLFSSQTDDYKITVSLMDSLSRIESYRNTLEIIDKIDLRFIDKNLLFIKTVAGACIEVQYPDVEMLSKIRYAMSYVNSADFDHKSKGTIIVAGNGSKVTGSYSVNDRYSDFLSNNS